MKDCIDKVYALKCLENRDRLHESFVSRYFGDLYCFPMSCLNRFDDHLVEIVDYVDKLLVPYKETILTNFRRKKLDDSEIENSYIPFSSAMDFFSGAYRTNPKEFLKRLSSIKLSFTVPFFMEHKDIVFSVFTIVLMFELEEKTTKTLSENNTISYYDDINNNKIPIPNEDFIRSIREISIVLNYIFYVDTYYFLSIKQKQNGAKKGSTKFNKFKDNYLANPDGYFPKDCTKYISQLDYIMLKEKVSVNTAKNYYKKLIKK